VSDLMEPVQSPLSPEVLFQVTRLRDHLSTLDKAQFDMGLWETHGGPGECGTCACLGGWQGLLLGDTYQQVRDASKKDWDNGLGGTFGDHYRRWIKRIRESLGFPDDYIFLSEDSQGRDAERTITLKDTIRMLDRYIITGVACWDGLDIPFEDTSNWPLSEEKSL
jgi:hypothetical protein